MAQVLGTGKQRSGKNAAVLVGASVLVFAKWEANYTADDLDTVNFTSEGLDEGIAGIEGADWSCGGDWDAGDNPYDDPPGLIPRDDLADLHFYDNVADDTFWFFPYARVRSARNSAQVKDKVSFDASGKSQGTFSPPTGSV